MTITVKVNVENKTLYVDDMDGMTELEVMGTILLMEQVCKNLRDTMFDQEVKEITPDQLAKMLTPSGDA